MEPTNLTLSDLLASDAKLTFLVGAGCSIDPPSSLPAGQAMMNALIQFACAESEVENILNLKELRFEALVEIIRDQLDQNLRVIDYYGLCDKPNLHHLFLADMIKKGNFVITTNFDFLIEQALLDANVPKEDIVMVITKDDFQKFPDPVDLFKQGKKSLYKIHGSTKNLITGEETKDSLIATIQAFGSNKEGLNVFQVEPFKRPLFNNIANDRSLVVMGYSGSDDFDIVPTLKVLKNLHNFIWINYVHKDKGKERVYEIGTDFKSENFDNMDKVNKTLLEIRRTSNANNIYRVDGNTSRLIESLSEEKSRTSHENFSYPPSKWLMENIEEPNEIRKYNIASIIYLEFDRYEDFFRCCQEILRLAEQQGDDHWKAVALNKIGIFHGTRGNYTESFNFLSQAFQIFSEQKNIPQVVNVLYHLGKNFFEQNNSEEGLKFLGEGLKYAELLESPVMKGRIYHMMGKGYEQLKDFPNALTHFEQALTIADNIGDLDWKGYIINDIGEIHLFQKEYDKALQWIGEALKIAVELENFSAKSDRFVNLGGIYRMLKDYEQALQLTKKALQIDRSIGLSWGIAIDLTNLALIYQEQQNYPKALKHHEEALEIYKKIENLPKIASSLSNIGLIYLTQEKYHESIKYYEESHEIGKQHGDIFRQVNSLLNIGLAYRALEQYEKTLEILENVLALSASVNDNSSQEYIVNLASLIYENLANLTDKVSCLRIIGTVYQNQNKNSEALDIFEKGLILVEETGDLVQKALFLSTIGNLQYFQGNYPDSLLKFEEALAIEENLNNLSEKANCLLWIGLNHLVTKDLSKALEYMEQSHKIYSDLEMTDYVQQVQEFIDGIKKKEIK